MCAEITGDIKGVLILVNLDKHRVVPVISLKLRGRTVLLKEECV